MTSTSERLPRIPNIQLTKLAQRTLQSADWARQYNKTISEEDQEALYRAGICAIAEKIWHLASTKSANPEELRIYLDLYLKHREQKIKEVKNTLLLRRLEILEKNARALEEAAKDRGLSDAQFFGKIRDIFVMEKPSANGNANPAPQTARLLEDRIAS